MNQTLSGTLQELLEKNMEAEGTSRRVSLKIYNGLPELISVGIFERSLKKF